MNFLNIFENHVAGILGAAQAPFSFKKLAKQTAREMEEQTLVVNGVNTAPALYTVLIANDDDPLMAPYYPELTRELSEFVKAQAQRRHYSFVGEPLVRFMIDPSLKAGKFSVFGENVDAPTLARLYEEERAYQSGISEKTSTPAEPIAAEPEPEMEPQPCKQRPTPRKASAGVSARVPEVASVGAGFAGAAESAFASSVPEVAPIPVPKTVSREMLSGMGGAAATAGTMAGTSIASNMANARAQAQPAAQLVDVVTGDVFEVRGSQSTIGRERALCDIALTDPNVSRRHAQLIYAAGAWSLEDLNSTNGTMVNNRRITRCPLRDGDILTLGLSTFEFRG